MCMLMDAELRCPHIPGRTLAGALRKILKDIEMTAEEFMELL